jgi:hypothetical protein
MQATKLPGNSNTAQDLFHTVESLRKPSSSLIETLMAGAATAGGFGLAGIPGAVAGAALGYGKHIMAGMRNAGIKSAADLVREGILNPEVGKTLLMASPYKAGIGSHVTLANALAKSSMFAAETRKRDDRKHRASGGGVSKTLSHEQLVSRLMDASEKAKAAAKRETKAILDVPDNTVAKALAVAQNAI